MKRLVLFVVVSTLFVPYAAADFVRLVPPAPDSNDSIEVRMGGSWRDGCVPADPEVRVEGSVISITLAENTKSCPAVITAWRADATFGPLAPGYYTLNVYLPFETGEPPALWRSLSFPVFEADVQFEILPSAGVTTGGYEVTILGQFGDCSVTPPCPVPQVLFDGTPAVEVRDIPGGVIAVVPPHDVGTADVELRTREGAFLETLSSGFHYFEPSPAPDPAAFKPVLLPVFFEGAGAQGSQWTTEAWMFNRGEAELSLQNPDSVFPCPSGGDSCRTSIDSRETFRIEHGADRRDRGLLLFVPRSQAEELELSLHIRDLSRQAESAGTAIPVISEEDLQEDFVQIMNIPIEDRFRQTLRIFNVDGNNGARVEVQAFPMSGEQVNLGFTVLTLEGEVSCGDEGCRALEPASATLNDFRTAFPQLGNADRIRLEIRAVDEAMRIWGFVSVTNNETQHVTTMVPD